MFRIATVGSLVLWAAIVWCTVALSLALHRAPVTISHSALAASLVCICLAAAVMGLWIEGEMRGLRTAESGARSSRP